MSSRTSNNSRQNPCKKRLCDLIIEAEALFGGFTVEPKSQKPEVHSLIFIYLLFSYLYFS